jgi:hypothetical protein
LISSDRQRNEGKPADIGKRAPLDPAGYAARADFIAALPRDRSGITNRR